MYAASTDIWRQERRLTPQVRQDHYSVSEYRRLLGRDRESIDTLNTVSNATCAIFQGAHLKANAVLIAPDLLLTSAHAFDQDRDTFSFINGQTCRGKVVFDGRFHSRLPCDAAIVQIPSTNIQPVRLSISTYDGGEVCHMAFRKGVTGGASQIVKPYHGAQSMYATRSTNQQTGSQQGDSGGPRLSLGRDAVIALHQGRSEALWMNQVLLSLEACVPVLKGNARAILDRIDCPDYQMRYMENPIIGLEIDSVPPEAKVPADVSFPDYIFRVAQVGVNGHGSPKVRVRLNNLINYLARYNDAFIDQRVSTIFSNNGIHYSSESIRDMSDSMWVDHTDHRPGATDNALPGHAAPRFSPGFRGDVQQRYGDIFKELYELCKTVSDGSLVHGLAQYPDPGVVPSGNPHISQKFEGDHFVNFPSKQARDAFLLAEAARRDKPVQTVLTHRERDSLAAEIASVDFDTIMAKAEDYAMRKGQSFSILFKTQNKYSLCEAERTGPAGARQFGLRPQRKDQFMYTPEKINGAWAIYHYDSSAYDFAPSPDTKAFKLKRNGQEFYLIPN